MYVYQILNLLLDQKSIQIFPRKSFIKNKKLITTLILTVSNEKYWVSIDDEISPREDRLWWI